MEDRIEFLLTVPLFQRLPKARGVTPRRRDVAACKSLEDEHPVVASMCEGCKFKRNDQIIKSGTHDSTIRIRSEWSRRSFLSEGKVHGARSPGLEVCESYRKQALSPTRLAASSYAANSSLPFLGLVREFCEGSS